VIFIAKRQRAGAVQNASRVSRVAGIHHPKSLAKADIKKQPPESELKRLSEMDKGMFYEDVSKALLLAQRNILQ
jgi:hypothetical protein